MSARPFARAAATLAVLGGLLAAAAVPASAATRIEQPTGYSCGNAIVSVPPPRVYANYGRTEQVIWTIRLQRWTGSRWANYSDNAFWASFNHFGRSPTSWSVFNTTTGGRYLNSRMNLRVRYRGYYRVVSSVVAPGLSSTRYVGGSGRYCWMP